MRAARRVVAILGLVAAGATVAAGCGGPARPTYDVAPSWSLKAPADAGTATAFCGLLSAEVTDLRSRAVLGDRRTVEADYAGFFQSLPALVPAAPASLRPDVVTYVEVTTDFYEALLQRSFAHSPGPGRLASEADSPAVARAVTAVVRFAAAKCHPDPIS